MGLVTTLPHGRPLTRHDLASMPDDGHRYELIDGTLVVSPSPSWRHQRVVLAVEVLSPSTARIDRWLKLARYEASGTAAYWIVDPADAEITAWELVDGRFVEVGHAGAEETLAIERPFPVTVVPTDPTRD